MSRKKVSKKPPPPKQEDMLAHEHRLNELDARTDKHLTRIDALEQQMSCAPKQSKSERELFARVGELEDAVWENIDQAPREDTLRLASTFEDAGWLTAANRGMWKRLQAQNAEISRLKEQLAMERRTVANLKWQWSHREIRP